MDDGAQFAVGRDGSVIEVIPERLRVAMNKVWADRGTNDLTQPIELEFSVLEALRRLGHGELVEDLQRQGRPPSGRMSKKAALTSMSESGDACLRYAAGLLPALPKQRVAKQRAGSDRLPMADRARLMRFYMEQTGWTATKTAKFLAERLDGEYDPRDLRIALKRDSKLSR